MSIHHVVFVPRGKRLPSADEWNETAAGMGFQLAVSQPFNAVEHEGGLPVRCNGLDAAFEYHCDSIDDYLAEVGKDFSWIRRLRLRFYRYAVSLVTHSREDDYFAAVVAAASLCLRTGGLLLDCSSGRFIAADKSRAWARATAKAPSPQTLARRSATAETVYQWVKSALVELGYEELPRSPRQRSGPGDHWFARPGTAFPSELVEASIYADGDESFLGITFFGTKLPLAQLTPATFMENAAGYYLYQALAELGRPYEEMLPQNIPIDEMFGSNPIAEQLQRELREADAGVFPALKKSLEDDDEW